MACHLKVNTIVQQKNQVLGIVGGQLGKGCEATLGQVPRRFAASHKAVVWVVHWSHTKWRTNSVLAYPTNVTVGDLGQ
jgi:hypothetical protein